MQVWYKIETTRVLLPTPICKGRFGSAMACTNTGVSGDRLAALLGRNKRRHTRTHCAPPSPPPVAKRLTGATRPHHRNSTFCAVSSGFDFGNCFGLGKTFEKFLGLKSTGNFLCGIGVRFQTLLRHQRCYGGMRRLMSFPAKAVFLIAGRMSPLDRS